MIKTFRWRSVRASSWLAAYLSLHPTADRIPTHSHKVTLHEKIGELHVHAIAAFRVSKDAQIHMRIRPEERTLTKNGVPEHLKGAMQPAYAIFLPSGIACHRCAGPV